MPAGDHTTKTAVITPTVLTIGCSTDLADRCATALLTLGAMIRSCDLASAATMVAQRRPLVMVLPEDVYAFDPVELDALARDVGASLLRVEEEIDLDTLELLLSAAIDRALSRRRAQGAVILALDDVHAGPTSWRKTAPRRRSFVELEAPPSSEPASGSR